MTMTRVMFLHRSGPGAPWVHLTTEETGDQIAPVFKRAMELLLATGPWQLEVWRPATTLLNAPTPIAAMRLEKSGALRKARPDRRHRGAKPAKWYWWSVSRTTFTDRELDEAVTIARRDLTEWLTLTTLRELVPTRPASVPALRAGLTRLVDRGVLEPPRRGGWYRIAETAKTG